MYGTTYDRIDGNVICGWLNIYCAERADYFETKSSNQHLEFKKLEQKNNVPLSDEVRELWKKIRLNLEADVNSEFSKAERYKQFKKNYEEKNNNQGAEERTQEGN